MPQLKIISLLMYLLFFFAIYRFLHLLFYTNIYPIPTLTTYGTGSYKIVILAGCHGNESLPGKNIEAFFKNYAFFLRQFDKATFYVIPEVNKIALEANLRHTSEQIDLNRGYPDQTPINQYITDIIRDADLVLDFHEAHEFHRCPDKYPDTLGQIMYVNQFVKGTLPQDIVNELNRDLPSCEQWDIITTLPKENGTLDEWCISQKIPYILFEFSGQENPREDNHKAQLIRKGTGLILHAVLLSVV